MLAQTAESPGEALARVGAAAVEWKLDGARIQVHRRGDEVRVFTRNLADITERVPEVVDGGPRAAGRRASSSTARRSRFGRTVAREPVPGDDEPLRRAETLDARVAALRRSSSTASTSTARTSSTCRSRSAARRSSRRVPESMRRRPSRPTDAEEAERFLEDAIAHGHEGVMVKALDAPYEAGRRGAAWLKVKPVHTLDLVVLAAEWGHGRRRGACRTSTSARATPRPGAS